jgi:hypothetical protein
VFGIVLICVLIGDLCLVVMDDDEDVVCIKAPVPSNACTPRPDAHNGGAVRVRFNGEGSKSTSSPARPGKIKTQRRADSEYVRPKEWKVVRLIGPAAAHNWTLKTLILIFTRKLANRWNLDGIYREDENCFAIREF